jgi:hypothetical protein
MISTTAARISWLFPIEQEVYRVHRQKPDPWPAPGGRPAPMASEDCARCGGRGFRERGARAAVYFFTRERHTECAGMLGGIIHHGCIPAPGQEIQRMPARRLPAK